MYTHTLLLRLGVYEFGRSFLGCLVRLKDLGCLGGHGGGGQPQDLQPDAHSGMFGGECFEHA